MKKGKEKGRKKEASKRQEKQKYIDMLEYDTAMEEPASKPMYIDEISSSYATGDTRPVFLEISYPGSLEYGDLVNIQGRRGFQVPGFANETAKIIEKKTLKGSGLWEQTWRDFETDWRELMSHAGGVTLPGDKMGQYALDYYAECAVDPELSSMIHAACTTGGLFSALWTPSTSLDTVFILGGAAEIDYQIVKYGIRLQSHYIGKIVIKRNLGGKYGPGQYWHINFLKNGKNAHFILKRGKIIQQMKHFKHLK